MLARTPLTVQSPRQSEFYSLAEGLDLAFVDEDDRLKYELQQEYEEEDDTIAEAAARGSGHERMPLPLVMRYRSDSFSLLDEALDLEAGEDDFDYEYLDDYEEEEEEEGSFGDEDEEFADEDEEELRAFFHLNPSCFLC